MTQPAYAPGGRDDPSVHAVAAKAIELIQDGARVGLGSGRAASMFIVKLGARRREGLRVSGVPTSHASADEARRAGIPLIELGEGGPLDLTIDGADEVAPNLDLVKGWGGALVRERIVAAASSRQIILVGEDKLVRRLGERGRVPVEVIPLAEWLAVEAFKALGLTPSRRMDASGARSFRHRQRKPHRRLRATRALRRWRGRPGSRTGAARNRRRGGYRTLSALASSWTRNSGPRFSTWRPGVDT